MLRRSALLRAWQQQRPAQPRVPPPEAADVPLRTIPPGMQRRTSLIVYVLTRPRLALCAFLGMVSAVFYDYCKYGYIWMVVRCSTTAYLALRLGIYYWWMERGVEDPVERIVIRSRCHEVASEEVLHHFLARGGVYLKIGQMLSTLTHVLPLEWCATMRPCLDHASSMPLWMVALQFMEPPALGGLNDRPQRIFREWNPVPVKAASIAQVHVARAPPADGGTKLAVKVKYRDVEPEMWGDVRVMQLIARLAHWQWPEFDFTWLHNYFARTLQQELDFVHEGESCERFRRLFRDWADVTAPRVFRKYSSRSILTMEYIDGFNVDDKKRMERLGIPCGPVAARVAEVVAASIFDHGVVHADPHPANIFVQPFAGSGGEQRWRLQWLDHGLYQELSDSFRSAYARLWVALVTQQRQQVEAACRELGVGNWRMLATVLSSRALVQGTVQEGVLTKADFYIPRVLGRQMALGVLEILGQVPEEMVLVLKCNDLLRSVQTELGLPVNYFAIMARAAQRRLNAEAAAGKSGRELARAEREGAQRMRDLEAALAKR
eukprot:TRINITY_DN47125_c0_g1_i1.p1 TRINITY_DN47125_c0_g1~~TRINITY_DN47125_c0_g1_i1.p1  ORF type:complete len:573 (+),score=222.73 TRINITY_DN47125_c0_g1_i1:78-1721(+)